LPTHSQHYLFLIKWLDEILEYCPGVKVCQYVFFRTPLGVLTSDMLACARRWVIIHLWSYLNLDTNNYQPSNAIFGMTSQRRSGWQGTGCRQFSTRRVLRQHGEYVHQDTLVCKLHSFRVSHLNFTSLRVGRMQFQAQSWRVRGLLRGCSRVPHHTCKGPKWWGDNEVYCNVISTP
jgi:hypothetical protein